MFAPGLATIQGAVTLPVRRRFRDPGPGKSRENKAPGLILPLAVKINGTAFESSAPDQESSWRRGIGPCVFPLRGLGIEGAETEPLDDRSLIRSLEKFQRNAAIQDLARPQPAGALTPGSIRERKEAVGAPLAFKKIKLLCLRVCGFDNSMAHIDLRIGLLRNRVQSHVIQGNLNLDSGL